MDLTDRRVLGGGGPVQPPDIGDASRSRIMAPVTTSCDSRGMQVHQHDHVGAPLHLLDHRPGRGSAPTPPPTPRCQGRRSARPSGRAVDAHAVEGVHWRWAGEPPARRRRPPPRRRPPRAPPRCRRPRRGTGRPTGPLHVGQALEDIEVGTLVGACRSARQWAGDTRSMTAITAPSWRTGMFLHRHPLADDGVVDLAPHDLAGVQAISHQVPLGLIDRLPHQVLLDQGGRAVVRAHLARDHQFGVVAGRVRASRRPPAPGAAGRRRRGRPARSSSPSTAAGARAPPPRARCGRGPVRPG